MKRTAARIRTIKKRRLAVMTGVTVIGLASIGWGIPTVMASVRSAPVRSAPNLPAPRDWPAAKADHMRAEDQLRQAAASRPLMPPPALPAAPSAASAGGIQQQSAGTAASAGQAGLTQGIMPLGNGGPFQPSQFLGTNLWNGRVGARWEVVQAGGIPADPALGAASPAASAGLFVYTRSPDPASAAAPSVIGTRAPSPDPGGMFTVSAVRGTVLTLTLSGSRHPYYFNVVTLRFTR